MGNKKRKDGAARPSLFYAGLIFPATGLGGFHWLKPTLHDCHRGAIRPDGGADMSPKASLLAGRIGNQDKWKAAYRHASDAIRRLHRGTIMPPESPRTGTEQTKNTVNNQKNKRQDTALCHRILLPLQRKMPITTAFACQDKLPITNWTYSILY